MSHMIQRVLLTVADVTYPLAATEHVDVLKAAIRDAVRSGGDFVDVTLDTGRPVSIFTTSSTPVIFLTVDTVDASAGTATGEEATDSPDSPAGMYDIDTSFDII